MSAAKPTGMPPTVIRDGRDLRAWRRAVGVTQEALASATGASQSWISALETGHNVRPSVEWVGRLSEVSSIPVQWGAPDPADGTRPLSPFLVGIVSGAALGFAMGVAMGVSL